MSKYSDTLNKELEISFQRIQGITKLLHEVKERISDYST